MKNTFTMVINGETIIKNAYNKLIDGINYSVSFCGELYNKNALRNITITRGYITDNTKDEEILTILFHEFKEKMLEYINGVFSIVILDNSTGKLFVAVDRLGVKPIYYSKLKNGYIISSTIKDILDTKLVTPVMTKQEVLEMFALGPSHIEAKTCLKDISSLKPGTFITISNSSFNCQKYWSLKSKELNDTEDDVIYNTRYLVQDAMDKQSTDGDSCMLSGGLDSTILTTLAVKKNRNIKTYSIDYVGNDEDFTGSSYQTTKDSDFISLVQSKLKTNNTKILVDSTDLFNALKDSTIAREAPGMADVDSSMLIFAREIAKKEQNIISGECSDEIFGGYPWYYKEHLKNTSGFPWALSEKLRQNLINPSMFSSNDIEQFIKHVKENSLTEVEHISNDSFENEFRDLNYLTIKHFMPTLIERGERLAKSCDLNIKMPYADYRIFEYVYNVSGKLRLGNTTPASEKYILKEAFKDIIPKEIIERKKSPFPKTYNPKYLELVEKEIIKILNNETSRILEIVNKDYIINLVKTHGENIHENLFGQLMTYPQTLAYLIQIEYFLEYFNVEIKK